MRQKLSWKSQRPQLAFAGPFGTVRRPPNSSLYGRGVAKLKNGDSTGGIPDIAAAKAIQADIVDQFSRVGIMATE
jgi:hypothetical protein